jgi:uncharacterized protein YodC (DUF2158 family)
MAKFKVGDVVQLMSGGPKMTVTAEGTSSGQVFCNWHTKDEECKGAQFPEGALVKVPGGYSPPSDDSGRV